MTSNLWTDAVLHASGRTRAEASILGEAMRYQFNFEAEPFAAYPEFEEQDAPQIHMDSESSEEAESYDTETADAEWHEELLHGRRTSSRPVTPHSRSAPFHRPINLTRPPRPTIRPRPRSAVVFHEPAVIDGSLHSEEYIRWVQRSLNQLLGLRLPLTGAMEPATRSAIRSFQRQQGLAVSGIMDPETNEALKAMRGGQRVATEEVEEEVEVLGPISATLKWFTTKDGRDLFTRDEAKKKAGGGVYIVVNTTKDFLKVGRATGLGGFNVRLADSKYAAPNLRFYLARITTGKSGTHGIAQVAAIVEYAIVRLLYRLCPRLPQPLKMHTIPFLRAKLGGNVTIENILPPSLRHLLQTAYPALGARWGGDVSAHPVLPGGTLVLKKSSKPTYWELSSLSGRSSH